MYFLGCLANTGLELLFTDLTFTSAVPYFCPSSFWSGRKLIKGVCNRSVSMEFGSQGRWITQLSLSRRCSCQAGIAHICRNPRHTCRQWGLELGVHWGALNVKHQSVTSAASLLTGLGLCGEQKAGGGSAYAVPCGLCVHRKDFAGDWGLCNYYQGHNFQDYTHAHRGKFLCRILYRWWTISQKEHCWVFWCQYELVELAIRASILQL